MTDQTCWYNKSSYQQMIDGANGRLWPKLYKAAHWPTLKNMIQYVVNHIDKPNPEKSSVMDIGCGAGSLQEQDIIKNHFTYWGMDLPGIIDNVAKAVNKNGLYTRLDIVNDIMSGGELFRGMNIYTADLVVMNAFLDVCQDPIKILSFILNYCCEFVIIHRQIITRKPTEIIEQSSYGGKTYISHINIKDFLDVIDSRNFDIIRMEKTELGRENYSFLLRTGK